MAFQAGMVLLGLVLAACDKDGESRARSVPLAAPAFWVWHRSSALRPQEVADLRRAGIRELYWQVAECEWKDARWQSVAVAKPQAEPADLRVTPVFRIKPMLGFLGAPGAAAALAKQIHGWAGGAGRVREVQLDFDCPDRLLGEYAGFLRHLGRELAPTQVSITALAGWPRHPQFDELARAVVAMAPMFYDLEADVPAAVKAGQFKPLADRAAVPLIGLWKKCPVPWRAGLPNFERVSVFGADGKLSGHLRGWAHDPLFFAPDLTVTAVAAGMAVFAVRAPLTVAGTRLVPGQSVVWRAADGEALAVLAAAAERSGASGMIYFALPGPGIETTFSPGHLACQGRQSVPPLAVELDQAGVVVLTNPGPADLPPRPCDPAVLTERGWQLELSSSAPGAFRPASPGGFMAATVAGGLAAEAAGGMLLSFSRLPGGAAIVSGRCIADPSRITWRVRGLGGAWQPLSESSAAGDGPAKTRDARDTISD